MKKVVLICAVVAIFIIYTVLNHESDSAILINRNSATGTITASTTTSTHYKDGTYTGSSEDAFYGTIQVQATIKGDKLADIQFLQYPNDRDESVQINQQAMPMLKQEAIQAQSVQVAVVSGATQSSEAFVKSLASAFAQAKS